MSFRASLSALAERSPVESHGEITSTFFLVLYVAQALPVMGVGVAAAPLGLESLVSVSPYSWPLSQQARFSACSCNTVHATAKDEG